jgi:uncharacterized membrane protein
VVGATVIGRATEGAVTKYELLIFFHLVGVVVLAAGAGVGMASGIVMTRTDEVRTIATLSRLAERVEHFVTSPGAVITLVTGTWLLIDFDFFDLGQTWLWLSYVFWIVAVSLGEGVLAPFHRDLHRQAATLERAGVERSAELQRAAASPRGSLTGMVLTALLVAFLSLMVFQPGR